MPRFCARPDCSDPATAVFAFDGSHAVVWIDALEGDPGPGEAGLCGFHASTLRAPRGWTLHDRRAGGPTRPPSRPRSTSGGAPAPATVPAPARRRERARERSTPTVVTMPLPFAESGGGPGAKARPAAPAPVLEARTPLLARAFRAAG